MRPRTTTLLLAAFVTMGAIAFAQKPPRPVADPTVYVTESGKKYHKKDCRLKKGSTGIKLSAAKKKGYKPCEVCKPAK